MSCTQVDLKGFFLNELVPDARQAVEEHLRVCPNCREELERLSVTRAALTSLREEETPRRIAFVSDKVLEPSIWRRFWDSAPRLGFASAAMLSVALLVNGFIRPQPAAPAPMDSAAVQAKIEAVVAGRVAEAVQKAVADSEARSARRTADLLAATEQRLDRQHRADLLTVEDNFRVLQKRVNIYYRASNDLGSAQ
ncbi:MAG TPA: zf-HC2 domain-containing protein [Bryobacteraceae bacterium]|nr:zf-HC2 domain-containing protein [Bryobacteraceae bacterium]